ncbi:MAG: DUF4091 domain-containing protein [Clostridia bacterium]|nr:DUF4091 domain-containing protein [Clostridia bacterium]
MTVQMKMVSSLEKCFYDDLLESKKEKNKFVMFKNERLSFQVIYRTDDPAPNMKRWNPIKLGGALKKYATVRLVSNVLNMYPTTGEGGDGVFERKEPGAYPDLLRPLIYPDAVSIPHAQTLSLWVDIELPEDFKAGTYDVSLTMISQMDNSELASVSGEVTVIDALLPPQKLIHTEWFYTDSIANYYHTRAFSEKHWKYIESFLRTATKNGVNMILTPLVTPELDTYVGGERMTTQLVDIELVGKDKYKFGFDKLRRWIDLCLDCGVEYFEIPHMFSQWGATATPKIIVKVNGRSKKYFGWHTDSMSREYEAFLSQFYPAVIDVFKEYKLDKKLFFHVSDEPHAEHLEHYKRCKELIEKYVGDRPIIDALSSFDFYSKGVLKKPVPKTQFASDFIEAGVENLWVYYCGNGAGGVSGRNMSMPLSRTRVLGVQLYKYNIEGFLHWGYNFYNSAHSRSILDPYGYADGSYFTTSGDCFLVYPSPDGKPYESLRLNALREAMDDMRALSLYEERFGREATLELIGDIDFISYPTDPDYLLNIREVIAKAFM